MFIVYHIPAKIKSLSLFIATPGYALAKEDDGGRVNVK
jgi:hypothetical protein